MRESQANDIALERRRIVQCWRKASFPASPIPTGVTERRDPLDGIRGVIFDLYGTLFVSAAGDIGHAGTDGADDEDRFRNVLRQYRLPLVSDATDYSGVAVWRDCIHRAHAAAHARGIAHPEIDIRDICRETISIMQHDGALKNETIDAATIESMALDYEAAVNPVWPMPEVRSVLSALNKRGLLMGIVSNAQFFTPFLFDALIGQSTQRLGFKPELCVWSYRLGEAKPSVRLFECLLANAATHGIRRPAELLYVGNDMLNDVYTARQAGLRTALFAGDRRSLRMRRDDARCRGLQPDAILANLAAIPDWLAQQGQGQASA